MTKDLDIVILDFAEEPRGTEFLSKFSRYAKENEYECRKLASGKSQSYRFTNPKKELAPKIIEISTRRQDGIPLEQAAQRLEEFEMSAIVCEPYFIELLKLHNESVTIEDGLSLPVAKVAMLILTKSYAVERLKDSKSPVDQEKVRKHLNDILRLASVLVAADTVTVPPEAYRHLELLLAQRDSHFSRERLDSCGWKKLGMKGQVKNYSSKPI